MTSPLFTTFFLLVIGMQHLGGQTWRSELYPEDWVPPGSTVSFENDKLIQDFSRAGYRSGDVPVPEVAGPVFNVTDAAYGADPSGASDSTAEIQSAIDAAQQAGGGVVYIPAGLYRVAPRGGDTQALLVTSDNIVLRGDGVGQTRLLNTSIEMRQKYVIRLAGAEGGGLYQAGDASSPITEDLTGPTQRIPVADVGLFPVGTQVYVRADATDEWFNEHSEPGWLGFNARLGGFTYPRVVTGVDRGNSEIIIDIPTRYFLRTRDNARVVRESIEPLTGCGVEDLSIGNVENLADGWESLAFITPGDAGYQTHSCYLVRFESARDCWVQRVESFNPEENTLESHMLSSGLNLFLCSRITVRETHFQQAQYGGSGGNGYMYRIERTADCLFDRCRGSFSRHGFVISHMASSGNVLLRCEDRGSGRQIANIGGYNRAGGSGSDHHQHFSHSNLIDACYAEDSHWEANYRPFGSDPQHNITAAHSIFWNTRGEGGDGRLSPNAVVRSNQARYGYVIGTRGSRSGVKIEGDFPNQTGPLDYLEGEGMGDQLEPFSLYDDQRARRSPVLQVADFRTIALGFPSNSVRLEPEIFLSGQPISGGFETQWSVTSGPGEVTYSSENGAAITASFEQRGLYELRVRVTDGVSSAFATVPVDLKSQNPGASESNEIVLPVVADAYLRGGSNANRTYGDSNALVLGFRGEDDKSTYRALTRFNLAALAGENVTSAEVVFTASRAFSATQAPNAALHFVADDTWADTVTWASQPSFEASPLSSFSLDLGGVERIDITEAVRAEAVGDQAISLLFRTTNLEDNSDTFRYGSKEDNNEERRPRIVARIGNTPVSFDAWADSLPRNQQDFESDPDGDGLSNYAEFVLGLDPLAPSMSPVQLEEVNGALVLNFTLSQTLPETVGMVIEASGSLERQSWGLMPGVIYEAGQGNQMSAVLPASAAVSEFYRIRFF